jgi:hypothetical protein
VHIGQVLARVRLTHPECRTTAGKDYAIIWLDDLLPFTADQLVAVHNSYQQLRTVANYWLRMMGKTGQELPLVLLQSIETNHSILFYQIESVHTYHAVRWCAEAV